MSIPDLIIGRNGTHRRFFKYPLVVHGYMSEDADGAAEISTAVVLDYLPYGRADDDRPQYQKPQLAHAVDTGSFALYELVLREEAALNIGDRVAVDPPQDDVAEVRNIGHEDLSGGAVSELEHVVGEVIEEEEARFVEFFNEAGAITLRLHQFNLLPGIGDKLRDAIIDERKRDPFESLSDLEERVSGLHDPEGTLAERILDEIRDEDVKYKLFAREDA
jgi:putative nucleotide binding protein